MEEFSDHVVVEGVQRGVEKRTHDCPQQYAHPLIAPNNTAGQNQKIGRRPDRRAALAEGGRAGSEIVRVAPQSRDPGRVKRVPGLNSGILQSGASTIEAAPAPPAGAQAEEHACAEEQHCDHTDTLTFSGRICTAAPAASATATSTQRISTSTPLSIFSTNWR